MAQPKSVAQLSLSLNERILAFAVIGVTSTMEEKIGRVVAHSRRGSSQNVARGYSCDL
jgi:hypothetical protein